MGDEGNLDTGIGLSVPGVGIKELGNAIPGVEEQDIETPGVGYLYVDVYLELDTGTPGVKLEIPPEATDPVKTTGVAESETTGVAENE